MSSFYQTWIDYMANRDAMVVLLALAAGVLLAGWFAIDWFIPGRYQRIVKAIYLVSCTIIYVGVWRIA